MDPPKIDTNHASSGFTIDKGSDSDKKNEIPIEELITMYGMIEGQQVSVLKDDGCNTNVISSSFVKRYLHLLNLKKASFVINHSSKDITDGD